jgi:hypothetical protein
MPYLTDRAGALSNPDPGIPKQIVRLKPASKKLPETLDNIIKTTNTNSRFK